MSIILSHLKLKNEKPEIQLLNQICSGSQNCVNSVTNSITLGPTFCCVSNNTRILRKSVIQTLEPVLGDIKYNITFSCNLLCPNSYPND